MGRLFRYIRKMADQGVMDLFDKQTYRRIGNELDMEELRDRAYQAAEAFIAIDRRVTYGFLDGKTPLPTELKFTNDDGHTETMPLGRFVRVIGSTTSWLEGDIRWKIQDYMFGDAVMIIKDWQNQWRNNGLVKVADAANPILEVLSEIRSDFSNLRGRLTVSKEPNPNTP